MSITEPLTVRMLLRTKSLNHLFGMHRHERARMTKMHREQAWKHMRIHGPGPSDLSNVTVTLTRYSAGTLDDDNLRGSLKAIRDGVADWLGVPDNDPRVTWAYAQRTVDPKKFAVEVEVRPA